MRISRLTKALLVAITVGLWLAQGQANLARTVVFVLGAVLVTWAWIALRPARPAIAPVKPDTTAADPQKHCADRRIERKRRGRIARDVRCPASRATARARRSTRR